MLPLQWWQCGGAGGAVVTGEELCCGWGGGAVGVGDGVVAASAAPAEVGGRMVLMLGVVQDLVLVSVFIIVCIVVLTMICDTVSASTCSRTRMF